MRKYALAAGVAAILLSTQAAAQQMAIDVQGSSPNRVVVYASLSSSDRTPISDEGLAGPQIRELKLSMIYEAPEKPYWTEMAVQFKCPSPSPIFAAKRGKSRDEESKASVAKSISSATSAEYRVSSGETKWKHKEAVEQLAPTEWKSTSSYPLMRAYRIACQSAALREAISASANETGNIDNARLGDRLAALGLKGAAPAQAGYNVYDVADFTWSKLWSDAAKPAVAYRNVTPAEVAQAEAELATVKAQTAKLQQQVRERISEMQRDNTFVAEAATLRGGRELSKSERLLLNVWLGKSEREVVARNGPPSVNEAGGIRFLSYGASYDNRVLWSNIYGGNLRMAGGWETCNVTYGLTQDEAGEWRVYDVDVHRERGGDSTGANVCRDLYEVPNP